MGRLWRLAGFLPSGILSLAMSVVFASVALPPSIHSSSLSRAIRFVFFLPLASAFRPPRGVMREVDVVPLGGRGRTQGGWARGDCQPPCRYPISRRGVVGSGDLGDRSDLCVLWLASCFYLQQP